jgi:hypothetical protein
MVALVKEVTPNRGPWIITYSGTKFHLGDPAPEEISIEDIAHALSNICRFTGHIREYYSVAEHSVLVSNMCDNPLEGLLHDASEAYMADLNSPLKSMLPEYKKIQHNMEKAINERFGIPYPFSDDLRDCDTAQLKTEARNLLADSSWTKHYPTKRRYGIVPSCLSPRRAKQLFLDTFQELTGA